jgi:hypothetical protein
MSQIRHPQGPKICKMLLEMRPVKEICSTLGVQPLLVRNQADHLGLLKIGLTREERLIIAAKRGINPKLVP